MQGKGEFIFVFFLCSALCLTLLLQTYKGDPIPLFGPLQDGMVVRGEVLPELVRLTAMTANRYVRFCFEGYRRPFPTRRLRINEVVERYAAPLCAVCPCVLMFCADTKSTRHPSRC